MYYVLRQTFADKSGLDVSHIVVIIDGILTSLYISYYTLIKINWSLRCTKTQSALSRL